MAGVATVDGVVVAEAEGHVQASRDK